MRISDWSSDVCSSDLTWVLKSGERTLVDSEGVALPLSTAEYNLMLAFVTRPNQVLSRDQLLDITQGREANPFDRAIDNQISRLRRKIEEDPKTPRLIKTVWGGGYTLAAEVRRSEEHTSELQSLMRISYAVLCLQKKNNLIKHNILLSLPP